MMPQVEDENGHSLDADKINPKFSYVGKTLERSRRQLVDTSSSQTVLAKNSFSSLLGKLKRQQIQNYPTSEEENDASSYAENPNNQYQPYQPQRQLLPSLAARQKMPIIAQPNWFAARNQQGEEEDKPHIRVHITTEKRSKVNNERRVKRELFGMVSLVSPMQSLKHHLISKNTKEDTGKAKSNVPTNIAQKRSRRSAIERDDQIEVPFEAEHHPGVVYNNKQVNQNIEPGEKREQILRMQKRSIKDDKQKRGKRYISSIYNLGARGPRATVHGAKAEKNPILQLLRAAAGTKTQKILGLNSKSFDIFPGPLPEEHPDAADNNLAKVTNEAPMMMNGQQGGYGVFTQPSAPLPARHHHGRHHGNMIRHMQSQQEQFINAGPASMFQQEGLGQRQLRQQQQAAAQQAAAQQAAAQQQAAEMEAAQMQDQQQSMTQQQQVQQQMFSGSAGTQQGASEQQLMPAVPQEAMQEFMQQQGQQQQPGFIGDSRQQAPQQLMMAQQQQQPQQEIMMAPQQMLAPQGQQSQGMQQEDLQQIMGQQRSQQPIVPQQMIMPSSQQPQQMLLPQQAAEQSEETQQLDQQQIPQQQFAEQQQQQQPQGAMYAESNSVPQQPLSTSFGTGRRHDMVMPGERMSQTDARNNMEANMVMQQEEQAEMMRQQSELQMQNRREHLEEMENLRAAEELKQMAKDQEITAMKRDMQKMQNQLLQAQSRRIQAAQQRNQLPVPRFTMPRRRSMMVPNYMQETAKEIHMADQDSLQQPQRMNAPQNFIGNLGMIPGLEPSTMQDLQRSPALDARPMSRGSIVPRVISSSEDNLSPVNVNPLQAAQRNPASFHFDGGRRIAAPSQSPFDPSDLEDDKPEVHVHIQTVRSHISKTDGKSDIKPPDHHSEDDSLMALTSQIVSMRGVEKKTKIEPEPKSIDKKSSKKTTVPAAPEGKKAPTSSAVKKSSSSETKKASAATASSAGDVKKAS